VKRVLNTAARPLQGEEAYVTCRTHEIDACPHDSAHPERIVIHVGEAVDAQMAPGSRYEIPIPRHDELEKCERGVVAWVGRLDDGSRAFFKLYMHRPRTRVSSGIGASMRSSREFNGLSRLTKSGVSCTPPRLWGHCHTDALGRVEAVVTTMVEGAEPLRRELQTRTILADDLDWSSLLRTIDAMHAAGVHHCGLSAKNILVDPRGEFVMCDLARSMLYPTALGGTRMAFFDYVHLFEGLVQLLGRERGREILAEGSGGPEFAGRVIARTARYHRRRRLQRKALRAEFHLRNLWASAGGAMSARTLEGRGQELLP